MILHRACAFFAIALFSVPALAAAQPPEQQPPPDSDDAAESSPLALDPIRAFGVRSSLIQAGFNDAEMALRQVPGGTNLINLREPSRRSQTLQDALSFQPGLVVQEFFGGNDQPRLNIRGSGIQSNPQARGVRLLRDGLPLNLADGSYVIGAVVPHTARHVTVHRGANAIAHGGTTLGGAIDFVSPTGQTDPGSSLMIGGGSFGEMAARVRHGGSSGKNDYLFGAAYNRRDGFRDHNEGEQGAFSANFGRRHSDRFETRLYLDFSDVGFHVPGPLNAAQLAADPGQVNQGIQPPPPGPQTGTISVGPNVVRDRPWRDARFARVATRSAYIGELGVVSAGLSYMNGDDVFGSPNTVRESLSDDLALNLRYQTGGQALPGTLEIGLDVSHGVIDRRYHANERGRRGREFARNDLTATDSVAFLRHRLPLAQRWTLTTAVQGVHAVRDIDERFASPGQRPRYNAASGRYTEFSTAAPVAWRRDYSSVNGRLGVTFEASARHQLYANLSQSFEPPTFLELLQPTGGNPNQGPNDFGVAELDAQQALTLEAGSRGETDRFKWDLAAYRSLIEDELLTSAAFFGGVGVTSNYPADTVHQGIELGLETALARQLPAETRLDWQLVYNYSDFFFDGGEFDGKQIAGVPRHQIQSELRFSHPSGLFFAPNLRWLPEDTPTDHANTIDQDSYALLGLTAGFEPAQGNWSLVVDARNLTDRRYASSYLVRERVPDPGPPNAGPDQVTTFQPGNGRSVSVELRWSW